MLTAEDFPTSGSAFADGVDVFQKPSSAREKIGYCPQFDALFDFLTGEEHMYFYGRMMGVPQKRLRDFSTRLLTALGTQQYSKRQVRFYSGGNRRKLSLAISLLGGSKVIFLDEPSSGVDPASRRELWALILSVKKNRELQRAIVLTTHSMEECEALSDNIGIMAEGRLLCLGSASHLKAKFGQGYQLEATLASGSDDDGTRERFLSFVQNHLPGCSLIESVGSHSTWNIPDEQVTLSKLFRLFESNKSKYGIVDYAISQPTLEQIFVNFNKKEYQRLAMRAAAAVEKEGEEDASTKKAKSCLPKAKKGATPSKEPRTSA